ncbi:MAG: DUF4416 family protein [Sphaerochaeta sp.]
MGTERSFTPSLLVMGLLITDLTLLSSLNGELVGRFGPIKAMSEPQRFEFTDYYDKEMGTKPWRLYLCFERLVDPSSLADIKKWTNALEASREREGRRTCNLDPGLLGLSSLILATTKARAHRIPLHSGIHAEVTLIYQAGAFSCLPWTYQDYRSEDVRSLLKQWRADYHRHVKQEGNPAPF